MPLGDLHARPAIFAFALASFSLSASTGIAVAADCSHGTFGGGRAADAIGERRDFDLVHTALDLAIDPEQQTVSGDVIHRLTPLAERLTRVKLDFEGLTIDGIWAGRPPAPTSSAEGRTELAGGLRNAPALKYTRRGRDLLIDLDRTLVPGDTIEIAIRYHGRPRSGLTFIHPTPDYPQKPYEAWSQGEAEYNHFWFPVYDRPDDRATTEERYTVPAGYTAVGNGQLVSESAGPGHTTVFQYRMNVPHSSYLVSVAVGRYRKDEDTWRGKPVQYFTHDFPAKTVKNAFGNTPDMLEFFSNYTGVAYPYDRYAQTCVSDFTWGGMENISATTLTERTLYDETARLDRKSDSLVSHELAHQWFGDLLTTRSWADLWLNEGFATFFEALYFEHKFGADEYMGEIRSFTESYQNEDADHYRRPVVTRVYENPDAMFDRHTYQKGALVLHMLRGMLGEDTFRKGIRLYTSRHAGQTVETDELRMALEDASGQPLTWFFDQWLRKGGYPELKFAWKYDAESRTVRATVDQEQCTDELTPLFRVPLDFVFLGDDAGGSDRATELGRHTAWLDTRHQEYVFDCPVEPRAIVLDPGNRVLKKLTTERGTEEAAFVLRQAGSLDSRCRAAEDLGRKNAADALAPLSRALFHDASWLVSNAAALSIGKLRTPAARDTLIEALSAQADPRVREKVAVALGEFAGDAKAAAGLARALREDRSYYVSAAAGQSLGKIRAAGAGQALTQGLGRDSFDDTIRRGVLQGLGELHEASAVPVVKSWAAPGRPERTRQAALEALGQIGYWMDERSRGGIREYLEAQLADESFPVQMGVLDALGELGDPAARGALEAVVDRAIDGRFEEAARRSLDRISRSDPARGSATMQTSLDDLKRENRELRERLEKLEQRLETP